MFILDPDFYPSRIPDPGSNNNNQREGEIICCYLFLGTTITKWKIIFEQVKEKMCGKFTKNYSIFYQKNCNQALKNMVLVSGICKIPILDRILDPGFRGQKGTGSGIRNTDGSDCLNIEKVGLS
jgi:hypothetical protein